MARCELQQAADFMDQLPPKPLQESRKPKKEEPEPLSLSPRFKHDWYQTEKYVIVNIFAKNVPQECVNVSIESRKFAVLLYEQTKEEFCFYVDLAYAINPSHISWKILSTKIEVKLCKESTWHWESLEATDRTRNTHKRWNKELDTTETPVEHSESTNTKSSRRSKWDKFAADLEKELEKDEKENMEGANLDVLLKKLFSDGNDDQKKAMQKSLIESKGTVLSTDWAEVGKAPVKIKAPDGQEFKKY